MSYKKIFQYLDQKQRRNILGLLKKHGKKLDKIFIIVLYSIGSIQNKYQQRPGDKRVNGDYGRRWRKALDRLIDAQQEDFIGLGYLLVHIDPTKLDTVVAKESMRVLQPRLRSLQERFKLRELHKAFGPIKRKELEVLLMRDKNLMVIGWIHFAEIRTSGGSAQEIGICEMFGVPVYLNASEDVIKKYSRHVIDSIVAIKDDFGLERNVFHTAEDTLNRIRKDIPKLRRIRNIPALGELFVRAWNKKMIVLR